MVYISRTNVRFQKGGICCFHTFITSVTTSKKHWKIKGFHQFFLCQNYLNQSKNLLKPLKKQGFYRNHFKIQNFTPFNQYKSIQIQTTKSILNPLFSCKTHHFKTKNNQSSIEVTENHITTLISNPISKLSNKSLSQM